MQQNILSNEEIKRIKRPMTVFSTQSEDNAINAWKSSIEVVTDHTGSVSTHSTPKTLSNSKQQHFDVVISKNQIYPSLTPRNESIYDEIRIKTTTDGYIVQMNQNYLQIKSVQVILEAEYHGIDMFKPLLPELDADSSDDEDYLDD